MQNRIVPILIILAAATVASCSGAAGIDGLSSANTLPPRAPSCERVAHVTALYGGSFAYIEHEGRSVPAKFNDPICLGDQFRTGPGTKLEVTFESGGTVTLDVNTDPNFFQTAECFFISIFTGRMAVNKNDVCIQSGANKARQHSYVLYEAVPNAASLEIMVIQGRVETIDPAGYTVRAGQRIMLSRGQPLAPPTAVDPAVLSRLQSWVPVVIR